MKKQFALAAVVLVISSAAGLAADLPTLSGPGGTGTGAAPQPQFAVLWDQPLSTVNTGAYANQQFGDLPDYSCFAADDFVVPAGGWSIDAIFVPNGGWNGAATIACASMLHFEIWAEAVDVPAGYPGNGTPVWSLAVAPTDPQITISIGTGGIPSDVLANLTTPAVIPPGTYWFVFYPTADFATCGQFGRQPSDTTNGSVAQWINPGGGFGLGTGWQPWNVLGMAETDNAFRLEGAVVPVELQSLSVD